MLLIALLSTVFYGISIDSLELPGVRVEGLYIKLDKKLIVEAKSIVVERNSRKENSREEFIALLDKLPWLDRLFDTVDIKNIHFDNENVKILYKNDVFYVDSKYLTLDAKLSARTNNLFIHISQMIFKDFNLELSGKVEADLKHDTALFKGTFKSFNLEGNLALKIDDDMIYYVANSEPFHDLAPFMKQLESKITMDSEIGAWVYKKITAQTYTLTSLEGQFDLRNGDFFPYKMKAKASIKDALVTFHPDVKPAHIQSMDVRLENNQLIFDLQKAQYQGVDVTRSTIYIYNLLTKGAGIVLNLRASTLLNHTIHPILQAYGITLPITQRSGYTDAVVKLDIKFLPYDLDVKGYFIVHQADLLVSNAPMYSNYAEIELNNHLITLKKTNLQYDGLFDINGNGTFNTRTNTFNGDILIDDLHVGFGETTILNIQDMQTPAHMNITKEALAISLQALNADLYFGEGINRIAQSNLSLLYSLSPLMQSNGLRDGNISVTTPNFADFDIDLHVSDAQLPLTKQNEPLTTLDLKINATKESLMAHSKDDKIQLHVTDTTTIYLKEYDVIVEENNSSSSSPLIVQAEQSNLFIKDLNKTVLTDTYSVEKNQDTLKLKASYKEGNVTLQSDVHHFQIDAKQLNAHFVNTLAAKEVFDGGAFGLDLYGNDTKNFSGNLHIDQSYLKDFRLYNDLLSLINTLPALATFKGTDFDEKGYRIIKADILFSRVKNIITLHAISIDGVSADITGKGTIDLDTDELHIDLQLKTLKDVTKIIGKIPVVNYILFGEDNSIATAIAVRGTIKEPKVETQVLKDTISTPFNILKRTIELPFKLFTK